MRPSDLPLKYRLLLRAYRWRRCEAVPLARLRRPLSETRVALVTSAGLVHPGEPPFDLELKAGDCSYRVLRTEAAAAATPLDVHHRSDAFDRFPMRADRNVIFPLDRLHTLVAQGAIGSVAPRHLSFMGSIVAPGRLIRETAPAAANVLVEDAVDIALLVPV